MPLGYHGARVGKYLRVYNYHHEIYSRIMITREMYRYINTDVPNPSEKKDDKTWTLIKIQRSFHWVPVTICVTRLLC